MHLNIVSIRTSRDRWRDYGGEHYGEIEILQPNMKGSIYVACDIAHKQYLVASRPIIDTLAHSCTHGDFKLSLRGKPELDAVLEHYDCLANAKKSKYKEAFMLLHDIINMTDDTICERSEAYADNHIVSPVWYDFQLDKKDKKGNIIHGVKATFKYQRSSKEKEEKHTAEVWMDDNGEVIKIVKKDNLHSSPTETYNSLNEMYEADSRWEQLFEDMRNDLEEEKDYRPAEGFRAIITHPDGHRYYSEFEYTWLPTADRRLLKAIIRQEHKGPIQDVYELSDGIENLSEDLRDSAIQAVLKWQDMTEEDFEDADIDISIPLQVIAEVLLEDAPLSEEALAAKNVRAAFTVCVKIDCDDGYNHYDNKDIYRDISLKECLEFRQRWLRKDGGLNDESPEPWEDEVGSYHIRRSDFPDLYDDIAAEAIAFFAAVHDVPNENVTVEVISMPDVAVDEAEVELNFSQCL